MSIAAISELNTAPSPATSLLPQLLAAIGCAALADWLFYGRLIGVSLALFYAVIGIVAISLNRVQAARRVQIVMTVIFIAGLVALIEQVDMLSVIVASLATASFVLVMTARDPSPWPWCLLMSATVPLRGPFQFIGDVAGALQHMRLAPGWLGSLVGWIVPVSILGIFVALFSSANPLIEQQLARIDLRALLDMFSSWRIAFWIIIIAAIWPLLYRRLKPKKLRQHVADSGRPVPADVDYLFGEAAMVRSLILFNLLFALQSTLDLTYLWAGARLPDGMSHAEYAHRGAYPLIITALLAAAFALLAMRPRGPAETSRLIRPLVLAWIGQNILLVISSIFRLDLYIRAYSLTYLRLAAFIWMGLVAIGLALMLLQILRGKSTYWLLTANAMSLALVLYGCCFLNAPRLVAYYNVEHSRQVSGDGPDLDLSYLDWLGSAEVLPPIEARLSEIPEMKVGSIVCCSAAYRLNARRDLPSPENWRSWNFRTWRLRRYFANTSPQHLTIPYPGPG